MIAMPISAAKKEQLWKLASFDHCLINSLGCDVVFF